MAIPTLYVLFGAALVGPHSPMATSSEKTKNRWKVTWTPALQKKGIETNRHRARDPQLTHLDPVSPFLRKQEAWTGRYLST